MAVCYVPRRAIYQRGTTSGEAQGHPAADSGRGSLCGEHYHLGDEIYVRERITAGDVFGIYIEESSVVLSDATNDGSMGMLYVEEMHTADKDLQHPWKVI